MFLDVLVYMLYLPKDTVHGNNKSPIKTVLEKVSFTFEGTMRDFEIKDGKNKC